MNRVRLTVIMSTYNDEKYLNDCLESLANQTYPDFVVKLADDGSKDRTLEILESWSKRDPRFQIAIRHKTNKGLTATLNELLRCADTEYVARMDADDIAMPDRFARQVAYLNRHREVSVVGSWAVDIDEQGRDGAMRRVPETHESIVKMMLKANPLIHPSVMFRKEDILRVGGYNERYRVVQDYALWFQCVKAGLRLGNIPEPLIRYRVNAGHAAKRGLKYRKVDAAVRWNGARAVGHGVLTAAAAATIPIVIGIIPGRVKLWAMKHRDRIDPRQKPTPMLKREEYLE